jgi:hypothetical protein
MYGVDIAAHKPQDEMRACTNLTFLSASAD